MEPQEAKEPQQPGRRACSNCGASLHATGIGDLCPACLIERVLAEKAQETPEDARPFGEYLLIEEIGRGGVGSVYRAWHPKLERTVALKMLLGGPFAGPETRSRFEREVKAVARLRHPGIVALFESGEVGGIGFFTMELIEGRTLASVARDGPIPVMRACALVRKAALAVAHAHAHGVLHGDLKPSNILIDSFDEPKIADFGLARFASLEHAATVNVGIMGSPPYMAPEQASGSREGAETAVDVYALGAVLYHLVTGRPPHQGSRTEEILARVRDAQPVAPRLLNPSVPRDLETVCLKCLEKDPRRRYAGAQELAADLGRFERGEPVVARPVGPVGRAWRWSRRNRSLAAALAALVALLVAGAAGVARQAAINRREGERLGLEAYATRLHAASMAMNEGDFPLARRYLTALAPVSGRADSRGFEWRLLWAATAPQAERTLRPHASEVAQLAFSPDGRWLASNGAERVASLFDLQTGQARPGALGDGGSWGLAFDPGGRTCYVGVNDKEETHGTIDLRDVSTGRTLWSIKGWRISLSRDGRRMCVDLGQPLPWAPASGGVEIWDTTARRRIEEIGGDYRAAALSPDGSMVAMVPGADSVILWSIPGNRQIARMATDGPQAAVAFSPDGGMLCSCGLGRTYLWRVQDRSLIAVLQHPPLRVWSAVFSPDGANLATTCADRNVRIWDTSNGKCLRTLHGHEDEVWSAAYSPDGRTLASGGKDGSVLLWRTGPGSAPPVLAYQAWSRPLFSPDGRTLVVMDYKGGAHAVIQGPGSLAESGPQGWSPCGVAADGSGLLLWSTVAGAPLRWWDASRHAFGGAFDGAGSIDGCTLAQTGMSTDRGWVYQVGIRSELIIWNSAGGQPVRRIAIPEAPSDLRSAALSNGGRWFAWSRVEGNAFWLADLSDGSIRELSGHRNTVASVVFSPSGDRLASASADGSIRLWDCASGRTLTQFTGQPESADDVAFSPDGMTLASLGALQSVKFWHLPTGMETVTLQMPEAGSFLAFSPDGSRLAVTLADIEHSGDRGVRMFEAPPVGN